MSHNIIAQTSVFHLSHKSAVVNLFQLAPFRYIKSLTIPRALDLHPSHDRRGLIVDSDNQSRVSV